MDNAGLLTDSEQSELLDKLDEISERQQVDIVVVTTDSLNGKTPEAYADDLYDNNSHHRRRHRIYLQSIFARSFGRRLYGGVCCVCRSVR